MAIAMDNHGNGPSKAVTDSIRQRYPKEAVRILGELKWDAIMKCWYFYLGDLFLGVELDGYIHS